MLHLCPHPTFVSTCYIYVFHVTSVLVCYICVSTCNVFQVTSVSTFYVCVHMLYLCVPCYICTGLLYLCVHMLYVPCYICVHILRLCPHVISMCFMLHLCLHDVFVCPHVMCSMLHLCPHPTFVSTCYIYVFHVTSVSTCCMCVHVCLVGVSTCYICVFLVSVSPRFTSVTAYYVFHISVLSHVLSVRSHITNLCSHLIFVCSHVSLSKSLFSNTSLYGCLLLILSCKLHFHSYRSAVTEAETIKCCCTLLSFSLYLYVDTGNYCNHYRISHFSALAGKYSHILGFSNQQD